MYLFDWKKKEKKKNDAMKFARHLEFEKGEIFQEIAKKFSKLV